MVSKGANWKGELIYYNADTGGTKRFNNKTLENLREYFGEDDELATVRLVKDPLLPLLPFQLTTLMIYRLFVIMRTKDQKWWFSLEKVGEGLVLQKSRNLDNVKYYRRGSKRTWFNFRVNVINCHETSKTMYDVIDWLLDANELTHQYHFLTQNCKHFAEEAYSEIATFNLITIINKIGDIRAPLCNDQFSKYFESIGY